MNLLNLVARLAAPRPIEPFLLEHGVNTASEHLSVYMRQAPGLETDIALLGVEETDEVMVYSRDGTDWLNFLPLYMVEEMVQGGVAAYKSPTEIATRILDYARDDT